MQQVIRFPTEIDLTRHADHLPSHRLRLLYQYMYVPLENDIIYYTMDNKPKGYSWTTVEVGFTVVSRSVFEWYKGTVAESRRSDVRLE